MTRTFLNLVAFQAGWLACVLGAANALPWIGLAAAVGAVALHLALATRPRAELRLVLVALGLGTVFDSLLLATGWVSYPSGVLAPILAPYWILAMWALFATTLNLSLSWLKQSLPLAGVLGALGGPLSYLAGARLGGITLLETAPALVALAGIWALAMPVLVAAARRHNGIRPRPTALRLNVVTQES